MIGADCRGRYELYTRIGKQRGVATVARAHNQGIGIAHRIGGDLAIRQPYHIGNAVENFKKGNIAFHHNSKFGHNATLHKYNIIYTAQTLSTAAY